MSGKWSREFQKNNLWGVGGVSLSSKGPPAPQDNPIAHYSKSQVRSAGMLTHPPYEWNLGKLVPCPEWINPGTWRISKHRHRVRYSNPEVLSGTQSFAPGSYCSGELSASLHSAAGDPRPHNVSRQRYSRRSLNRL